MSMLLILMILILLCTLLLSFRLNRSLFSLFAQILLILKNYFFLCWEKINSVLSCMDACKKCLVFLIVLKSQASFPEVTEFLNVHFGGYLHNYMEKEKEVDTSVLRLDANPSTYESLASSHQCVNIVPLLVSLGNSFFSVKNIRARVL